MSKIKYYNKGDVVLLSNSRKGKIINIDFSNFPYLYLRLHSVPYDWVESSRVIKTLKRKKNTNKYKNGIRVIYTSFDGKIKHGTSLIIVSQLDINRYIVVNPLCVHVGYGTVDETKITPFKDQSQYQNNAIGLRDVTDFDILPF